MICDRCFASVKADSEFCPECGAPVGSGPAEGSDAAIYPELARVNLLRMRGEYKAAIDHCRTILRKFPNNVTANQLLGDLSLESGDLEQAKEWYELALDIAPNHTQIQRKLNDVRARIEHKETEGLVEQIGLPASKSKSGWVAVGLAVLLVAVGGIAYIVGTRKNPDPQGLPPKQTSFTAPANSTTPKPPDSPAQNLPATQVIAAESAEELAVAQLISQRSQYGSKLLGLIEDKRASHLILTYRIESQDDRKLIGAELAITALANNSATRLVTVRAISEGNVVYIADVHREAYEETLKDEWKQQNGEEPAAIAGHVMTQEWPAAGAASTTETPPTTGTP
ncbi:MAG TPA: tetratricopeptide repeat protein [Fimbriimonadaceae bacterium]|nr:tetratricopeptide repeat protein [Fimbriimonadaceae bacterium]